MEIRKSRLLFGPSRPFVSVAQAEAESASLSLRAERQYSQGRILAHIDSIIRE